jgi:NAD(P)-dependent dehydrogenase (short-subunit alcohol dehydrogenase family)
MATPTGVLITGGGSGIGLAIAREFVRTGHPLYSLSRSVKPSLDELAELARTSHGVMPRHISADVTDRGQLERARDEIERDGATVGVVIANSGVNVREKVLDLSDEDLRLMLDTNLYGVIATFQVFAPMALQGKPSRFIAIGSLSGSYGMDLRATYSATKAGLSGLVRALSVEWAPLGATVNAIAPGIVDTSFTRAYIEKYPQRAEAVIANTPVGRLATPEDVANVATFLASDRSGFITGQTIVVDGGLSGTCSWW